MLIIENMIFFYIVWNKLVFLHGGSDREKNEILISKQRIWYV